VHVQLSHKTHKKKMSQRHTCLGLSTVLFIVLVWAVFTPGQPLAPVAVPPVPVAANAKAPPLAGFSAPSTGLDWWNGDPPGMDASLPKAMWAHEVSLRVNASRNAWTRKHPQLVFIKGLKVGGTSVAVALNHVARAYGVKLQSTIDVRAARMGQIHGQGRCEPAAMYFHHSDKAKWMEHCIPNARFVTLLREPIGQALSWETMKLNHQYYLNYPGRPCQQKHHYPVAGHSLGSMLRLVDDCVDTPFRQNVTVHYVANQVRQWNANFSGEAVSVTAKWITGKHALNAQSTIDYLDNNYFLVGVTERLNEFLVLLALHMGWDPQRLYYERCKPSNVDVGTAMFKRLYPALYNKVEASCAAMSAVYEHARDRFDEHVRQLGPWFKDEVAKFENGLKRFQIQQSGPLGVSYKWRLHYYEDGKTEDC